MIRTYNRQTSRGSASDILKQASAVRHQHLRDTNRSTVKYMWLRVLFESALCKPSTSVTEKTTEIITISPQQTLLDIRPLPKAAPYTRLNLVEREEKPEFLLILSKNGGS